MIKIKRFENISENFDIKVFVEPWTAEKFKKIKYLKDTINNYDCELFDNVRGYVELTPELLEDFSLDFGRCSIISYTYYETSTIPLMMTCSDSYDSDFINFSRRQFDDFLLYLKNPEEYKTSKKYNL